MTKFFATKNQNKKDDKHPDYRVYKKDHEGNVLTEEYTKGDGSVGQGWKSFGAIWINRDENNAVKSLTIDIEDEQPKSTTAQQPQNVEDLPW